MLFSRRQRASSLFQAREQGSRVGQIGEVIGGGRILRLAELERIFNGQRHLRADRQQDAQVVAGECVLVRAVQRENTHRSVEALERHSQGGPHDAELLRIFEVAALHRRVAIENGLLLFRHPSREALPDGNLQRGKQAEILAIHVFRHQEIVSQNVDRDGIVRNQALEPDPYHREGFIQAERTSQLASQLKQQANLLAGRGDGIEEVAGLALVRMRDLEARPRERGRGRF